MLTEKENIKTTPSRKQQIKRKLPELDLEDECQFQPSLTLSGWNTTETQQRQFFEKLKKKQASKFKTRRNNSGTMSRKDIQSLLMTKNSPHLQSRHHEQISVDDRVRDFPQRDALKPKTYNFGNDVVSFVDPDLKQIVLPRHVANLSKVIRQLPNDNRRISFGSFLKSLHQENKKTKYSRKPRVNVALGIFPQIR